MAKVITCSVTFPAYHPRKGEHTNFIVNAQKGLSSRVYEYEAEADAKHHTIRQGLRWKKGDVCSLKYWTGRPYHSKQGFIVKKDVELIEVYKIHIGRDWEWITIMNEYNCQTFNKYSDIYRVDTLIEQLAKNDGLSVQDFKDWFAKSLPFEGQILVFGKDPEYLR